MTAVTTANNEGSASGGRGQPWAPESQARPKQWQMVAGWIADLVRVAGLLSIVAAFIWMDLGDVIRFSVAFLGLLAPRAFHLPRPFDAAYCVTLLLATWSGAAGWYEAIPWWDWMVHLVTNGAIAGAIYLILATIGVVHEMHDRTLKHSRVALVVLTAAFGFAVGAVWEFVEWIGEQFLPKSLHVGYVDSLGDMFAGGIGSVIAGIALVLWARSGRGVDSESNA